MNKKRNWKKWLAYLLVLVWMIVIFYMSAQPGEDSGEISGGVSHLFMQVWNAIFHLDWSEAKILEMAGLWDYPIRKLAHMTEFGILAMLIYWALGYTKKFLCGPYRRYVVAFLGTVFYAATDEFHQLFVPDRSGNLFDVFVDATGALLALGFICLLMRCGDILSKRRIAKKIKE